MLKGLHSIQIGLRGAPIAALSCTR